jgi:hypothetical protein
MSHLNPRWASIAVALPATLLLAAMGNSAKVAHVSGKFLMKYTQQHPLPTGGPAAPLLLASESKGTNSNTGQTEYMDGAAVTIVETADLTQGSGPHRGYVTFAKGGETSLNRFSGQIATRASETKQPVTTFEGTWTKISGTGRYDGVTGHGRYTGRMLSPTEFEVDWTGDLNLTTASSR